MSSLNLNKVIIAGRITAAPELRQTPNGASVCRFSVAVNQKVYKQGEEQKTDFLDVIAWNKIAEFVCTYFRKGDAICICGRLSKSTWEDKNGNKRSSTEIVAESADFVDSKKDKDTVQRKETREKPVVNDTLYDGDAPMGFQTFSGDSCDSDLPF